MITAIDTNILIDIFSEDKNYDGPAEKALEKCQIEGALVVSGVVLVEVMPHFSSSYEVLEALSTLYITPQTISMSAFWQAASIWQDYKRAGGGKSRVIADFLIGAHALVECDRLLTRDRGFYRKYFKKLKIIEPKIR